MIENMVADINSITIFFVIAISVALLKKSSPGTHICQRDLLFILQDGYWYSMIHWRGVSQHIFLQDHSRVLQSNISFD